ncbi:MAG: SGNH/GDSL hydrolase family protein [Pirellulales bacterium]
MTSSPSTDAPSNATQRAPAEPANSAPAAGQARRGRKFAFRALATLIGLVVGLLLAEGSVRLLGLGATPLLGKRFLAHPDKFQELFYFCYPTNPSGDFVPVPDVTQGQWRLMDYSRRDYPLEAIDETRWCVEYRISPQMMRDRVYDPVPPAGVLRIAMIGDSFVMGEGVQLEQTLPRQTLELLGPGYEVLNTGRSGFSFEEEVPTLQYFARDFHCPRAIVVFVTNDIRPSDELARRQNLINDLVNIHDLHLAEFREQAWYAGQSRLLELVFSQWQMRRIVDDTIDWYLDCNDPAQNAANLTRLAAQIRAMAEVPDCRVALVMYPLLESLEGDYPLQPIHDRVKEFATAAGLPVLDLVSVFRGQQTESLWAHPTDHHPNSRAHEQAARAIVDWLRRDVPGFLEPTADQPATEAVPTN